MSYLDGYSHPWSRLTRRQQTTHLGRSRGVVWAAALLLKEGADVTSRNRKSASLIVRDDEIVPSPEGETPVSAAIERESLMEGGAINRFHRHGFGLRVLPGGYKCGDAATRERELIARRLGGLLSIGLENGDPSTGGIAASGARLDAEDHTFGGDAYDAACYGTPSAGGIEAELVAAHEEGCEN